MGLREGGRDDVLLLRPARPESGFARETSQRPAVGASEASKGLVVATICDVDGLAVSEILDFFEQTLEPVLKDTGAAVEGYFLTESSPNNFPALPVREGENVFVWFSTFSSVAAYQHHADHFARSRVRWPLTKFCVDRPELSGSRQRPDPYFMADTLAVSHPRIGLILSMPVGSSPGQSGGSTGLNSQIGIAR